MSALNRKGPNEEGPMTGRRMGRCNPNNKGKTEDEIIQDRLSSAPAIQKSEYELTGGRGLGRGFGARGGLGRGRGMFMRFKRNS